MQTDMTAKEALKLEFWNGSMIEIHSGDVDEIVDIINCQVREHLIAQKKAIINALEKKLRGLNISTYNLIQQTYPLTNIK